MSADKNVEEMSGMLSSIIDLLKASVGDRKKQADKYNEMILAAAQDRAENMNMLMKLSGVVEKLTTEYTFHINTLKQNRDALMEQNAQLLEALKRKSEALLEERRRYDELLKQMLAIAKTKSTDTNINVR